MLATALQRMEDIHVDKNSQFLLSESSIYLHHFIRIDTQPILFIFGTYNLPLVYCHSNTIFLHFIHY